METKINVAELLKDCPKGMELDSPIWDGVVFDHINMGDTYPIYIKKMGGQKEYLTENGCFDSDPGAKCVIFPKGKDTWEGFKRELVNDNFEKKTLIKPKFKEGDRIILKDNPHNMPSIRIKKVTDVLYILDEGVFYITSTDEKYILKDNFDICDLKPFDKVLVRTKGFTPAWTIDFYDGYRPEKGGSFTPFAVSGGEYFQQCIPYDGNEHLLGTTNDCDDFYKNWEE